MKTSKTTAILTAALVTFALLAGGANGAVLFSIGNPYRHFQHQRMPAPGVWNENFNGICYATAAVTVSMSIADNNAGITLNGFTNTSVGAETGEGALCGVANTVNRAGTSWNGNGNWVGAPWLAGAGNLRVMDFYRTTNWATIPTTLPTLNVVGAFALLNPVAPVPPFDVEWWSNYHVVGVYEFDFAAQTMTITDSNKDRLGAEFITGGGHAVGGAILNGAGVLDGLSWNAAGILTNHGGVGIDGEELRSLRVLYLIPEPSSAILLGLGGLGFLLRRLRR